MDWYGIKVLFKISIHGKALQKDEYYPGKKRNFYSESVYIVKANSFDHAYELAEPIAQNHCGTYVNKYGQTVNKKVHAYVDCYYIGDDLEQGTEVYCSIFDEKDSVDKQTLLKKRYARSSVKKMHILRNSEMIENAEEEDAVSLDGLPEL